MADADLAERHRSAPDILAAVRVSRPDNRHGPLEAIERRASRSWNRVYGLGTRFLLGKKDGESFHLIRHLFPRTPMWRLREVDAIARRDPVYAALPRGGALGGLEQSYQSLSPQRDLPDPALVGA